MSSLQHNELVRSKSGAPPQCGIRARLCPEWANSVFGDVDSMSGLPESGQALWAAERKPRGAVVPLRL